jgi:hypothetical protein
VERIELPTGDFIYIPSNKECDRIHCRHYRTSPEAKYFSAAVSRPNIELVKEMLRVVREIFYEDYPQLCQEKE